MKAGWEKQLLQEVAIFQRGTSITKKQVTSGNIPVIAGGQKPAYYHNQKNREANSITISTSGAYAGFVSFHPYPVFASDCFTVESKSESLNQRFLFHFLKFKQKEIYSMQSGDAQPHVYVRNFNDFEIAFPPLKEQQRIVEILDESFAKLETARSNVAANLENSKELFQSVLNENLSGAEEKGWEIKPFGDLCEFQRGLTYSKRDEVDLSSNCVLRANNVSLETGQLDLSELKYISDNIEVPENKKVKKGCLLICTASGSRSHLGKTALIKENQNFIFGGFMGLLLPSSQLLPKFIQHFCRSRAYVDFISSLSEGTNINNLKWDQLKHLGIPLPHTKEQQNIVEKLDSLGEQTDRLQQEYTAQLTDFDDLRQSFLQKAFAGELT